MPPLSPAELIESETLAEAVATATARNNRTRDHLDVAAIAGVDQQSARWNALCTAHEEAIRGLNEATEKQRAWWLAKGFKV
jgi:hypothetical protein